MPFGSEQVPLQPMKIFLEVCRHRAGRRERGSNGTTSRLANRSRMPVVESFNARLRDEPFNETMFVSLNHIRESLAIWKDDYNARSAICRQPCLLNSALPQCNGRGHRATWMAPRPVPLHHRATRLI
jgi:hypothetical protein